MTEELSSVQPLDQDLTDGEVADIKDQLKRASAVEQDYQEGEESLYYDASTMASLNAFSTVSLLLILVSCSSLITRLEIMRPAFRRRTYINANPHHIRRHTHSSIGGFESVARL